MKLPFRPWPFILLATLTPLTLGDAALAQVAAPTHRIDNELIIGTKVAPPFAMKDGTGAWEGLSIDLWRRIAERLGLHFRFQEETLADLIAKTARGELDGAVAAISVTADRERLVDFTQPYYATGLGIAIPRAKASTFGLLRSLLSRNMLLALLGVSAVLVLVGAVVWLFERRHNEHFGDHGVGLRSSIMWAAMRAAGDSGDAAPRTFPGQLVSLVWTLVSVVLISSFTAVLTSSLTTWQLEGRVQSVKDLHTVRTGTVIGSAPARYLEGQGIASAGFADLESGLRALEAGRLDAMVFDRDLMLWTVKQKFDSSLGVLDVTFDPVNYAIALPPQSTLRRDLDEQILAEIGSEWWHRSKVTYLGEGTP